MRTRSSLPRRLWNGLLIVAALAAGLMLILPVAVIAALLAGAGIVTRFAARVGARGRRAAPWRQLVQYEPEIGWRPRSHLRAWAQADDVFQLTTDADGWRGRLPLSEAEVAVFGDSFAFGHGANDDAMYTAFAAPLRVKAIGSDGYAMVHSLLWMRRLAPALSGKLVVWFIYYGNDLHENLLPNMGKYRMPYVRQRPGGRQWEIVTEHVSPAPWPMRSPTSYHEIMAAFCCNTPFSERVFDACDFLIAEAKQVCADAGATLAVVGIPDRVQLTRRGRAKLHRLTPSGHTLDLELPDARLGASCRARQVPFVALSAHLTARDYLVRDIHWRRSGHRIVGALLQRLHREAGAAGTSRPVRAPQLAHQGTTVSISAGA